MAHLSNVLRLCMFFTMAGIISVFTISNVEAQQTTATIDGVVYEADGSAKADASIEAVHVASGALWTTTTTSSGNFHISGLRPGGPYTVSVVGTEVSEENLFVNISSPTKVNLVMPDVSGTL